MPSMVYGGWRPLPRHVIEQAGKLRPIDDGRAAGTNALSTVTEANVCIPPEFAILVLRAVEKKVLTRSRNVPEWCEWRGSVEDWWKGYRQLMPSREHMALAVAAVRHPDTGHMLYSQLRGLRFGLGAAVNQFVRLPFLFTAAARRLLLVLCEHHKNDNVILELAGLREGASNSFRALVESLVSVHLADEKRQPPSAAFTFLAIYMTSGL